MAIMRSKILPKKLFNYQNFELNFYPKIIKKYQCKFENINGFWHSIDNVKDLNQLSTGSLKIKIKKILKKLS